MACEHITLPGGGGAIVCSSRRRQRCACGRSANLLCDWKMPSKRSGTCDAPICDRCSTSPAPDKDLCPAHATAFEQWNATRTAAGEPITQPGGEPTKPASIIDARAGATAPRVLTAGAQP